MEPKERAVRLASLHVKGDPLVLYNAWDAGSAKAIAEAGAAAIGTSSWAVAAAQGHPDGESIPLSLVEENRCPRRPGRRRPGDRGRRGRVQRRSARLRRERRATRGARRRRHQLRRPGGLGSRPARDRAQCARIPAIRRMAEARGIPLFINARTDLFFGTGIAPAQGLPEARERAAAYAEAGASGLFVPGLLDRRAIADLCGQTELPVNVMVMPGLPDVRALAAVGVARVSHGPAAYVGAMEAVRGSARSILPPRNVE